MFCKSYKPGTFAAIMPPFRSAFKQTIFIWISLAILLIAAFIFWAMQPKASGYLMLVPYHSKPLDVFFTWFTYLGDGIFIILLAVALLLKKYKWQGIAILVSYGLSGLLAQIIKNLFPSPRPAVYFRELGQAFYQIPDVTLLNSNASFPSGHTASVFALLATLILLYPNSRWKLVWCVLAVAVGYSRMYLGNHFLADVMCGAALGIISACITMAVLPLLKKKQSA